MFAQNPVTPVPASVVRRRVLLSHTWLQTSSTMAPSKLKRTASAASSTDIRKALKPATAPEYDGPLYSPPSESSVSVKDVRVAEPTGQQDPHLVAAEKSFLDKFRANVKAEQDEAAVDLNPRQQKK